MNTVIAIYAALLMQLWPFPGPGRAAVGGGASHLFSETFDGATLCLATYTSNCDNSWTVIAGTGTPDFDNATSPAPLFGTYSLLVGNSTSYILGSTVTGHSGGAVNFATAFVTGGSTSHSQTFGIRDSGGTIIGYVRLLWSTDHYNIRLYYNGAGSNFTITGTIDNSELWYIKVQYTPGSGSNGIWRVYAVQDSAGFPGWGTALYERTDATDTANVGQVYVGPISAGTTAIFDQIKVSASEITFP